MTVVAETFVPPASSHIAAITYDPDVENMDVEFTNGESYTYFNVPVAQYRNWCAAGGSGVYFHRHIKNRFAYERA